MDKFAPKQLAMGGQTGGFFDKFKNKVKDAVQNNQFTDNKGISSLYYKGDKEDVDKNEKNLDKFGKDVPREEGGSRVSQDEAMAAGASKIFNADDSVMRAKQQQARQAMGLFNSGGGIASLAEGGEARYVPQPRPSMPQDKNYVAQEGNGFFDKIMGQVSSGLQSIGSGIVQAKDYYYENIDPFKDITDPAQRKRIGLAILGTQPTLGESPLGTFGRAASGALQQQDLMDVERRKADTQGYISGGPTSLALLDAVEGAVFTVAELGNPTVQQTSNALKAQAIENSITDPELKKLYNPKDASTRATVATKEYERLAREYKKSDEYKRVMSGGIPADTPDNTGGDTGDDTATTPIAGEAIQALRKEN